MVSDKMTEPIFLSHIWKKWKEYREKKKKEKLEKKKKEFTPNMG